MNRTIARLIFMAGCGAAFSGCITHNETVLRDVERAKVEFENETAGRIFYETLSKSPMDYSKKDTTATFHIPILFEHKEHYITGNNAGFNKAVEVCDSNKDGRITELEAKIFAEHQQKH